MSSFLISLYLSGMRTGSYQLLSVDSFTRGTLITDSPLNYVATEMKYEQAFIVWKHLFALH